jgi:Oxidoreductase family, NAD-binding Rossmann fold/Oxidoreductase family, C-terminal alpha/beta domain
MSSINLTTRRFFMGAATALAATRVWGANEKINVALVGLGGRGTNHLNIYTRLPEARLAAICDIDQAAREKANAAVLKNTGEKATEYDDMRKAFADPKIDAVSIATPNHWHALAAIWAMKAGKDVYGEKPACYNIYEGFRMVEVAHSTNKMMQVGSQHRSTPFKMRSIAALQGGLIGDIYLAKGMCYKRRASIGHAEDEPVPAGVDWDMFLGPAPKRAFNKLRFKYNWHWFWDTGNGDIGNQGVHEMGIARWGLSDPKWPKTAVGTGGKYAYKDDQETPNTLLASYDYGGRELVFEVRGLLTGADGTPVARRGGAPAAGAAAPPPDKPAPGATAPKAGPPLNVMVGDLFYGTEGWAAMSDGGFQAFKGESNELIMDERPERGQDTTALHMQNFLAVCKSRKREDLHDGLDNAILSAGLCHLANISYRTGHKLTLDGGAGVKFVNDSEANKMITRSEYRKPYVV